MRASWLIALCAGMAAPAHAQTANGTPTAPAPPGLVGTPRAISRTAPSAGTPVPRLDGAHPLPTAGQPRKPTAAERAEQKKLEQDLRICIGC